jgi:hypothetical protein
MKQRVSDCSILKLTQQNMLNNGIPYLVSELPNHDQNEQNIAVFTFMMVNDISRVDG